MKAFWELFIIFFRIGGFTFGGGYAMLPIIQKEIVDKKNWATEEEVIDMYAIGQSTPGIIAVNTATFIGYRVKGVIGAIVATLGMVTPSLIIITLIAAFFTNFQENQDIQHIFSAIRVCVVVLVLNAVIKMWKSAVKNIWGIFIFIIAFVCVGFLDISPIFIIVSSIILGIGVFKLRGGENK